jgi:hypothetical protein
MISHKRDMSRHRSRDAADPISGGPSQSAAKWPAEIGQLLSVTDTKLTSISRPPPARGRAVRAP